LLISKIFKLILVLSVILFLWMLKKCHKKYGTNLVTV